MEEKNDRVMKHRAHEHLLILNENYVAKEDDVCKGCWKQIDSRKSSSVYSCSNITSTTSTSTTSTSSTPYWCSIFLLHKICAEVPLMIEDPINQKEFLDFKEIPLVQDFLESCKLCFREWYGHSYNNSSNYSYICLKCAIDQLEQSKEDPLFEHPGHIHPLALIEQPSSFKCYACKVDNTLDSSYRCTKCQFWIHKSCGDAPHSFQFQFHKHPLIFSSSLPPQHRRFAQHCRLCSNTLNGLDWLYYCGGCRYFTHFGCARSSSTFRFGGTETETYPDLVQLPAEDESSLNLLLEKLIDDYNHNIYSIFSPTKNFITHWAHEEHDLKLITIDELYERKHDDEISLLCEGCVKPIRTDEGQSYYACFPCKFFMHKVCAELPREIEHRLWPGKKLFAYKFSEPFNLFLCQGCGVLCNGIFYSFHSEHYLRLHIGCVTLPKSIKHEAHPHQLNQFLKDDRFDDTACNADRWHGSSQFKYGCKDCKFCICGRCSMKERTYKHRWDPHPLELKYDAAMVEEHEHEFDCEFCAQEIDTNYWFHYCSKCDLSFHTNCVEQSAYLQYQYVKFGATDIIFKDQLHPHGLTFVLNKKAGRCMNCKEGSHGKPVLQCAPCNSIIFCFSWGEWCSYAVLKHRKRKLLVGGTFP